MGFHVGRRPPSRLPWLTWTASSESQLGSKAFEIRDLIEGTYDVVVVTDGAGGRGGAILHNVAAGMKNLAFALPKGETIEGVVHGPGGETVEFEQVQAYDDRGICWAIAERADGAGGANAFRLSGLPAGRYKIVAWLDEEAVTVENVAAPSTGVVVVAK